MEKVNKNDTCKWIKYNILNNDDLYHPELKVEINISDNKTIIIFNNTRVLSIKINDEISINDITKIINLLSIGYKLESDNYINSDGNNLNIGFFNRIDNLHFDSINITINYSDKETMNKYNKGIIEYYSKCLLDDSNLLPFKVEFSKILLEYCIQKIREEDNIINIKDNFNLEFLLSNILLSNEIKKFYSEIDLYSLIEYFQLEDSISNIITDSILYKEKTKTLKKVR